MEHKRLAEALLINHPELGVAGVKVDQAQGRVEVLAAQPESTKASLGTIDHFWFCLAKRPDRRPSGPKERHPLRAGVTGVAVGPGAKGTTHCQLPGPWDVLRILRGFPGVADWKDARHH